MQTMWDTPLVRGERDAVFGEGGGMRLDMARDEWWEVMRLSWKLNTTQTFSYIYLVFRAHIWFGQARPGHNTPQV
jgi:hypothetical protein